MKYTINLQASNEEEFKVLQEFITNVSKQLAEAINPLFTQHNMVSDAGFKFDGETLTLVRIDKDKEEVVLNVDGNAAAYSEIEDLELYMAVQGQALALRMKDMQGADKPLGGFRSLTDALKALGTKQVRDAAESTKQTIEEARQPAKEESKKGKVRKLTADVKN